MRLGSSSENFADRRQGGVLDVCGIRDGSSIRTGLQHGEYSSVSTKPQSAASDFGAMTRRPIWKQALSRLRNRERLVVFL